MPNVPNADETFEAVPQLGAPSQDTPSYLVMGVCVVLWMGLLAGAPSLLRYVYVATCFLFAVYLFVKHETHYVAFVWWLYFLTPFLRRVVDYRAGFDPSGFMLAAPLFATAVCCFELTKLRVNDSRSAPFALLSLGVTYGFVISLVKGAPLAIALQYFLTWLAPVAFGYYLYLRWNRYPEFRATLQGTFIYGMLVLGAYAVFQYFFVPAWDAYWMNNVSELIESFGVPEPMGIRVYSMMNSPQVFGLAMVMGLLTTMHGRSWLLRRLAWVAGYAGLLLTMSRSAWLEWAAALLALAALTRSRKAISTILAMVVIMGALVMIITHSSFGENLSKRFDTLSGIKNDDSGQERIISYEQTLNSALSSPCGDGWQIESTNKTSVSLHDSTVFELLMCTGWFGLLAFYTALLGAIFLVIRSGGAQESSLALLCAMLVAFLFETFGNSLMGGPNELGLLTCMGLAFAGLRYRDELAVLRPA